MKAIKGVISSGKMSRYLCEGLDRFNQATRHYGGNNLRASTSFLVDRCVTLLYC